MSIRFAARSLVLAPVLAALLSACGSDELGHGDPSSGSGGTPLTASSSSATGGSAPDTSSASSGGTGGAMPLPSVDSILAELRANRDQALAAHAADTGWPVPVDGGHLFVSTDLSLTKLAGDHDDWAGTSMTPDQGFAWVVIAVPKDDHYKLTDGSKFVADPWARSVDYDQYGEISIVDAVSAHLDRHFSVGDAHLAPRTVRVWVPKGPVSRVLYVHDGQNLFDPNAPWGGWHLQDTAADGMLLVGIDNTSARFDEYTHVQDDIDESGNLVGGKGDDYADFLQNTVRPLVKKRYGEMGPIGVMGSSLGGLISLEIAYRYPADYAFAASLSGTMGWGSLGSAVHNQTMIQRYEAKGHQAPILYIDSGGYGTTCADSDGDGTNDDDSNAGDNYCENVQLRDVLHDIGYVDGKDLHYWHEDGAQHNEAAWAARVYRPLSIFAGL
ncbi:putative alpha-dextrin endo-1, 6-alpha-glucosidase [Minicystis rosea]|nr:putative alpha-dextrin endo-1, 6-alpha-glucosidase [Minicystis rosea]